MTANERVFNVTRRFSLKWKQAMRAIENCSCTWVEGKEGQEIRDLTFAEAAQARKEYAINRPVGMFYWVEGKDRNGKPTMIAKPFYAEIPGFHVNWNTAEQQTTSRQSWPLIAEANRLAANANTDSL